MILQRLAEDARQIHGKVVFAEGDEERTLEAAVRLKNDGICDMIVVSHDKSKIEAVARDKNLDISCLEVLCPSKDLVDNVVLNKFIEDRTAKGMGEEEAQNLVSDPLYFAALYIKSGNASGGVAGARLSTSDVLRSAIHAIGTSADTKIVSSFFLMIPPEKHPLIPKPVIYADCGVNPAPNTLGLRDIAIASIKSFRTLFPEEPPKVAFLAFSTKGSAKHRTLEKIIAAVKETKEYFRADNSVIIDGELQFDAAAVPSVADRKSPESPIKGRTNIFIFPDLNSGNICYKATQRLGLFTAIGPIIQGLEKPFNDLSRGCSVDDIYHTALITLLQSKKTKQ